MKKFTRIVLLPSRCVSSHFICIMFSLLISFSIVAAQVPGSPETKDYEAAYNAALKAGTGPDFLTSSVIRRGGGGGHGGGGGGHAGGGGSRGGGSRGGGSRGAPEGSSPKSSGSRGNGAHVAPKEYPPLRGLPRGSSIPTRKGLKADRPNAEPNQPRDDALNIKFFFAGYFIHGAMNPCRDYHEGSSSQKNRTRRKGCNKESKRLKRAQKNGAPAGNCANPSGARCFQFSGQAGRCYVLLYDPSMPKKWRYELVETCAPNAPAGPPAPATAAPLVGPPAPAPAIPNPQPPPQV